MTPEDHINGADAHLLDVIEGLVGDLGPMTAQEIASRLAETGDAVAVIRPSSIETYEKDGETVAIVRGGSHRALSPDAVERRLSLSMSGFTCSADGRWSADKKYEVPAAGRAD